MLRRKLNLTNANIASSSNSEEQNRSDPDINSENKKPKIETNDNLHSSKYFNNSINSAILNAVKQLNFLIKELQFKDPIIYCYNPMDYAIKSFEQYVNTYCNKTKSILFVGMNPGPYGMCQTGIPFGDVTHVRDWLKINADIGKPEWECPERPILGHSCTRNEISGQKFWGLFKKLCATPDNFFQNAFVYNYCPLAFMQRNGGNITPNKIKGPVKKILEEACNTVLAQIVNILKPEYIIGIGTYAKEKCLVVKEKHSLNAKVLYLIHPSPIIPRNGDWPEKTEQFLINEGLISFFQPAVPKQ